jgi:hypothetical protein
MSRTYSSTIAAFLMGMRSAGDPLNRQKPWGAGQGVRADILSRCGPSMINMWGPPLFANCTASACRQNVRGLIGGNAMVPEIADAAATSEVNAKLTPHHSDIFFQVSDVFGSRGKPTLCPCRLLNAGH